MERRSEVRHEVSLAGELIWKNGGQRQRCTIKDISLNGARVDTRFYLDVPKELYLLENGSGNLFECQVKWQQGDQIGLFFLDVGSQSARRTLLQQLSKPG